MSIALNKKLIIAVVGESCSGKTVLCNQLEQHFGIKQIASYTDRPKRSENEQGHVFLTKEQYDKLDLSDAIASTIYGEYRYCCLASDLNDINTYTISEDGLEMLKHGNNGRLVIKSIRTWCNEEERIRRGGLDRVLRDQGRFKMHPSEFDIIYRSDLENSILNDAYYMCMINDWIKEVRG